MAAKQLATSPAYRLAFAFMYVLNRLIDYVGGERGINAKCRGILTAPEPVEILKLNLTHVKAPTPLSLPRPLPFLPLDVVQFACKIFWIREITRHYTEFVPRLSFLVLTEQKVDDVHLNGPPSPLSLFDPDLYFY